MIYRVKWEIDVDADNPRAAAKQAQAVQRDRKSTAQVYSVIPWPDSAPVPIARFAMQVNLCEPFLDYVKRLCISQAVEANLR